MKVKLAYLLNPAVIEALTLLSTETIVPKKQAWPLAKTLTKAKNENASWEMAKQNAYLKYGEKIEDQVKVLEKDIPALNAELEAILITEVDIPLDAPISIPSELPEKSKLTAHHLLILSESGFVTEAS